MRAAGHQECCRKHWVSCRQLAAAAASHRHRFACFGLQLPFVLRGNGAHALHFAFAGVLANLATWTGLCWGAATPSAVGVALCEQSSLTACCSLLPAGHGWTCAACTLINPPAFLACSACGSARTRLGAAAAAAAGNEHAGHPAQQQQQQTGPSNGSTAGGWACGACTYHNPTSAAACGMCGAEGPAATAAAAQAAAAIERAAGVGLAPAAGEAAGAALVSSRRQTDATAGAAAAGAATAAAAAAAAASSLLPALSGLYTLDCGCRLPAEEAQGHLQQLAGALPDSLAASVSHFCCPVQVRLLTGCFTSLHLVPAALPLHSAARLSRHLWYP